MPASGVGQKERLAESQETRVPDLNQLCQLPPLSLCFSLQVQVRIPVDLGASALTSLCLGFPLQGNGDGIPAC